MANSADPHQLHQLTSEEANWSGSTLFATAGHIRAQQDKVQLFIAHVCLLSSFAFFRFGHIRVLYI